MRTNLLIVLLTALIALPATARDFRYIYDGKSLTYTVIDESEKTVETTSRQVFQSDLGHLRIPDTVYDGDVPYTVVRLGSYSFRDNQTLTGVEIPNTVETIGANAFMACHQLGDIYMGSSIKSVESGAFSGISRNPNVTFQSIEALCAIEFKSPNSNPLDQEGKLWVGENYISDLVIPESVSSIGDYTFYGCGSINTVKIGNNVKKIGKDAFGYCREIVKTEYSSLESLCNIEFASVGSNPLAQSQDLWIDGQEIKNLTIPEGISSIGRYTFYNSKITSVSIPASVSSIGAHAFTCKTLEKAEFESMESLLGINFESSSSNPLFYAGHLYFNGTEITELVLPETVETLPDYVFTGWTALTTLTIPSSVKEIGAGTFSSLPELTTVIIPPSVKSLGDGVFSGCSKLADITLPNSIESIGSGAFQSCKSLTSIELPNSIEEISPYMFTASGLTSISIPESVKSIGARCFSSCTELTSIDIPATIYEINNSTFEGCTSLTSIQIPANVTTISDRAFQGCTSLSDVKFNNKLETIGISAFTRSALTEVVFPPSLETIQDGAFWQSKNLSTIIMGPEVKTIGDGAFMECAADKVYITVQTPPSAQNYSFTNYEGKLYIQGSDAVSSYKNAEVCWNNFQTEEMIVATDITTDCEENISGSNGDTFQLNATLVPENVSLPYIFWRTTNSSVATVDSNGLVTLNLLPDMIPHEDGSASCKIIAETLYADGPVLKFDVKVTTSGVDNILVDKQSSTNINYNEPYEVYTLSGRQAGNNTESLPAGLYIIRQADKACKVALR